MPDPAECATPVSGTGPEPATLRRRRIGRHAGWMLRGASMLVRVSMNPGCCARHQDLLPELEVGLRRPAHAHRTRAKRRGAPSSPVRSTRPSTRNWACSRRSLQEYEILERVRYGGQGVVYKARQRGTNRTVALKVLLDGPLATEQQRTRFAREIELGRAAAAPQHRRRPTRPGWVRGRNFYAMEFVDGLSINDYVVFQDLTPRAIVQLVIPRVRRRAPRASERRHSPRSESREHPGQRGRRAADLRLRAGQGSVGRRPGYSQTGVGCGTLPYLSPEQAGAGDGMVDVRSDVYAIGVVLYELLTDVFPYEVQGDPGAVRKVIAEAEPVLLRRAIAAGGQQRALGLETIDVDLERILAKALAKSKAERYQTAAALGEDLERWLAGEAVHARAFRGWYAMRKTIRRHRAAVGIGTVLLVALAATLVTFVISSMRVRTERDNARQALALAYDLFDISLNKLEESVRSLAGGTQVREQLVPDLGERLPKAGSPGTQCTGVRAVAGRLAGAARGYCGP